MVSVSSRQSSHERKPFHTALQRSQLLDPHSTKLPKTAQYPHTWIRWTTPRVENARPKAPHQDQKYTLDGGLAGGRTNLELATMCARILGVKMLLRQTEQINEQ